MTRFFRYEWVAWLVLAGLVASGVWLLPTLKLEFSLTESFDRRHPTRVAYERYRATFGLRDDLVVVVSGPDTFSHANLRRLRAFVRDVGGRPETAATFSPFDLIEPGNRGARIRVTRPLGPAVLGDPARLDATLASPGFRRRWAGYLFDESLTYALVTITPGIALDDPEATESYVAMVEGAMATHLGGADLRARLLGRLFVSQETLRVTARDQLRLTGFSTALQFALVTLLFGSARAAAFVSALLGLAAYLGFLGMAALGIPVNFMSGNLPVMVGVIGLADILHILAAYSGLRRRYRPRGAALRAMRRTFWPNLLTTVTTLGCVLLNAGSPMRILGTFSLALSIGVVVVYVLTILYGPLLFMRSGIAPGRGLYFRLQAALEGPGFAPVMTAWLSPAARRLWALFAALALGLAAGQRIDSNWFRNFAPDQPVTRNLEALHARGLPVSAVECTLRLEKDLQALLESPADLAALARLEDELAALDGVIGVFSVRGLRDGFEAAWAELTWPESLAPRWIETRKASAYRMFMRLGVFSQYWNPVTRELRLVLTTDRESSGQHLELAGRVADAARRVEAALRRGGDADPAVRAEAFSPRGQMLYWAAIIDWISHGTVVTCAGSVVVIFVCFFFITGRLTWAALALPPNLLPVVALAAFARLVGEPISEEFCTLAALAIGISVDDTLHLLYHYRAARRRGADAPAGIRAALTRCGAPVILTSACLIAGFSLCLLADMVPVWRTGAYLTAAVFVALWADLSLLPCLLAAYDRPAEAGAGRQYPVAPTARRRAGGRRLPRPPARRRSAPRPG